MYHFVKIRTKDMITEDYVSFETAKLLKKKVFNWEVHRSYLVNDNVFIPGDVNDVPLRKDAIRIPTLQMAMKWLREEHKLVPIILAGGDRYWFRIDKVNEDYWKNTIYLEDENLFLTYEEACEASIKYCLENLI